MKRDSKRIKDQNTFLPSYRKTFSCWESLLMTALRTSMGQCLGASYTCTPFAGIRSSWEHIPYRAYSSAYILKLLRVFRLCYSWWKLCDNEVKEHASLWYKQERTEASVYILGWIRPLITWAYLQCILYQHYLSRAAFPLNWCKWNQELCSVNFMCIDRSFSP